MLIAGSTGLIGHDGGEVAFGETTQHSGFGQRTVDGL